MFDLNNNRVGLIYFASSLVSFNIDNDGFNENSGWVDENDEMLVHDKNSKGAINDIANRISEYYPRYDEDN